MRHGKIILSAAALAVTAIGSFAFNGSKKGHTKPLFTTVNQDVKCQNVVCATASSGASQPCPTGGGAIIYYTDPGTCQHAYLGLTTLTL